MTITLRDREVVELVASFGQLSSTQIAAIAFGEVSRTPLDRSLNRLTKQLILKRIGRVNITKAGTAPFVYMLGMAGHRLLNKQGRWHQKVVAPHDLSVADCFVNLVEAQRAGKLVMDRFVKEYPIGEARADALVAVSSPDGLKQVCWFIEVDMGWQRSSVIQGKLRAYLKAWSNSDLDPFPRVIFLAQDMMRVRELRFEVSQLSPEDRELFDAQLLSSFPQA